MAESTITHQICKTCNQGKELSAFRLSVKARNGRTRQYRYRECKSCQATANRDRLKGIRRQRGPHPVDCTCAIHSPETKQKMSAASKGRPKTPKHRAKLISHLRAINDSPRYRQQQRASLRERYSDPIYREKHAEAMRRVTSDPEWLRKNREAGQRRARPLDCPTKRCPGCKVEKDKSEFSRNKRARDGLQNRCRICRKVIAQKTKTRRAVNDAAYRAANWERDKNNSLLVRYGITFDEYKGLFSSQGGICAICAQPESAKDAKSGRLKLLAVDHDHRTGKVRGLLCKSCNLAIGQFREHPERIQRAIDYLDKFK